MCLFFSPRITFHPLTAFTHVIKCNHHSNSSWIPDGLYVPLILSYIETLKHYRWVPTYHFRDGICQKTSSIKHYYTIVKNDEHLAMSASWYLVIKYGTGVILAINHPSFDKTPYSSTNKSQSKGLNSPIVSIESKVLLRTQWRFTHVLVKC